MTKELKTIDLKGNPYYRIAFMADVLSDIHEMALNGSPDLKKAIEKFQVEIKKYLNTTPTFGFSKGIYEEIRSFEITRIHQDIVDKFKKSQKLGFISNKNKVPNFAIMGSLYPVLKSTNEFGEVKADVKKSHFSAVLSGGSDNYFDGILIQPPQNKNAYVALNKTFMNRMFVLSCTNSNSMGSWSKYSTGQAKPTDFTWTMFLMNIGIHPKYKLIHRDENEVDEYKKSMLFNEIFLNTKDSIFKKYNEYKKHDLEKFHRNQPISKYIETMMDESFNDEEKDKLGDELDRNIYELSSVAKFLTINPSPNPNTYRFIEKLVDVGKATCIQNATWALYEKGYRIPHHSAWSLILVALDIHPIYRTVERTDPSEIELAKKIYDALHNI